MPAQIVVQLRAIVRVVAEGAAETADRQQGAQFPDLPGGGPELAGPFAHQQGHVVLVRDQLLFRRHAPGDLLAQGPVVVEDLPDQDGADQQQQHQQQRGRMDHHPVPGVVAVDDSLVAGDPFFQLAPEAVQFRHQPPVVAQADLGEGVEEERLGPGPGRQGPGQTHLPVGRQPDSGDLVAQGREGRAASVRIEGVPSLEERLLVQTAPAQQVPRLRLAALRQDTVDLGRQGGEFPPQAAARIQADIPADARDAPEGPRVPVDQHRQVVQIGGGQERVLVQARDGPIQASGRRLEGIEGFDPVGPQEIPLVPPAIGQQEIGPRQIVQLRAGRLDP